MAKANVPHCLPHRKNSVAEGYPMITVDCR